MQFNQISTVCLAVVMFFVGKLLVERIRLLNRFCIPAPVVGGLIFAIGVTVLQSLNVLQIKLDTSLQSLFMIAFFTTVGLGASFGLIKLGGKLLVIYWVMCGVLAFAQNIIGVSLASVLGLHPLIGVMAGAISMEGGHGAAAAYGQTVEALGVPSAVTIGLAAATFGLVAGGLVGGPIAQYLIRKHDLKPSAEEAEAFEADEKRPLDYHSFMFQVLIITVCMAVGVWLGELFTAWTGFVLPGYVGAMFIAVTLRNVIDHMKPDWINMHEINLIGDVSLAIFLSMALMSIKLWELSSLALPLVAIVAVQVAFIVLLAIFVMFRLLGKNYDAAVMVSGFLGHGLGATPNAMANMDAITQRFGPSRKAFLIVPIVGAFLIDVFAVPIIITTINMLK